MAYSEHIYMQRMDGKDRVHDLVEDWGMYGMEVPFKIAGDAKELYANDWLDEDGADEYVPDKIPMKAYDMELKLAFKGKKTEVDSNIRGFIGYVRSGKFRLFCTYTGIGRKDVRLVSVSDDAEFMRTQDYDLLIVTFVFRVNDPVTDVIVAVGNDDSIRLIDVP